MLMAIYFGVVGCMSVMFECLNKVIYVAVHVGFLDMTFDFRPYDSYSVVHQKYFLSAAGESFLQNPCAVMSVDPQSNVINVMLGVVESKSYSKCHQN